MKKILLAAALTALTSTAFAADLKPYIEGSVGYLDGSDSNAADGKTVKQDGDLNYGIEIGLKDVLVPGVRLAGSITHSNPEPHFYQSGVDQGAIKGLSLNIAMVNAYYDIKTNSPITPFVGVGLGGAKMSSGKDYEFAYALMAGAKYNITNNIYIGAKGSFYRVNGLTSKSAGTEYSDSNLYTLNALVGYEF